MRLFDVVFIPAILDRLICQTKITCEDKHMWHMLVYPTGQDLKFRYYSLLCVKSPFESTVMPGHDTAPDKLFFFLMFFSLIDPQ